MGGLASCPPAGCRDDVCDLPRRPADFFCHELSGGPLAANTQREQRRRDRATDKLERKHLGIAPSVQSWSGDVMLGPRSAKLEATHNKRGRVGGHRRDRTLSSHHRRV